MATTPEGKVKKQIIALFKAKNIYYVMPATGGYGRSGVPDFLACVNGHFVGIEAKAGKGKTTALQNAELTKIGLSGGSTLVINEENISELDRVLDEIIIMGSRV